jgi:peptidoglycan/LPS O-acetylase OafA/YrhL
MKKARNTNIQTPQKQPKQSDRILFFDILRILFVAIIVYGHAQWVVLPWFNKTFFADGFIPFNIYTLGLTGDAVYGMILVSGAVMEYNYRSISRFSDYTRFIFKRFIRLYPAFWMSLILGIILSPALLQNNLPGALFEFTGYYVVLGIGPGVINTMGWFIAAIFSLYLLYPILSRIVRRYQMTAIIGFCILSWGLRFVQITYNPVPLELFYRWFPLFNAFEFCLGIYIVQKRWYPTTKNIYPAVRKLADLSFYVFLFHVIVILAINAFVFAFFDSYIVHSSLTVFSAFYFGMMAMVLLVSWVAMILDNKIQQMISQNERVRRFLKPS